MEEHEPMEEATRRGHKRQAIGSESEHKPAKRPKDIIIVSPNGEPGKLDPNYFFKLPFLAQQKILVEYGINIQNIGALCQIAKIYATGEALAFYETFCNNEDFWRRKIRFHFPLKYKEFNEIRTKTLEKWSSLFRRVFFTAQKTLARRISTKDDTKILPILDLGVNVNTVGYVDTTMDTKRTPLAEAAALGNAPIVDRLLALGADPNIAIQNDEHALALAIKNDHPVIALKLIEHGANVHHKLHNEATMLMLACAASSKKLVDKLLEKGVNPNLANRGKTTPLHVCATNRKEKYVFALLYQGANPDLKDTNGSTPLGYAAKLGNTKVVKKLLEGGAHPGMPDGYYKTPLEYAILRGHIETVKALLPYYKEDSIEELMSRARSVGRAEIARIMQEYLSKSGRKEETSFITSEASMPSSSFISVQRWL